MDELEFLAGDDFLKLFEDLESMVDACTGVVECTVDQWELEQPCVSPMLTVPSLKRPVPPRFRIIDSDGPLAEWDNEINGNCDGVRCFTPQCHYNLYGIASSALWSMVALEAH